MVTISNTGFAPTSNLVATLTVQNATMVSGSANCTLVSQHRKVVGALQPDASLNYTASAIKAPPIGQTFNATFTLTLVDDAAIYPTYVATRTVLP
jgi:hypothetical protein